MLGISRLISRARVLNGSMARRVAGINFVQSPLLINFAIIASIVNHDLGCALNCSDVIDDVIRCKTVVPTTNFALGEQSRASCQQVAVWKFA